MAKILKSKPVAIGFLILFATLVVSLSIPYVVYLTDTEHTIYDKLRWLEVLFEVVYICAIVLIAIKSNIVTKIGCALFFTYWVLDLVNILSMIFTNHYLITYNLVYDLTWWSVITFGLYCLGFLLMILGARLWTPVKIVGSIGVVWKATVAMITIQWIFMVRKDNFDDMVANTKIEGIVRLLQLGFYVVTLILLIVSVCKTSKTATQQNKIDLI